MSPNLCGFSVLVALLGVAQAGAQRHTVTRIAGGIPPNDGIAAVEASLGEVEAVAVDPTGVIYLSADACIFRVERGGTLTRIAGTGSYGYSDADAPAVRARVRAPVIAFDPNGELFYADWGEVRKINRAGKLELVLPDLSFGFISAIAIDSSGNLYVAYPQDQRIRRVTPDGRVSVFAGSGKCGPWRGESAATDASLGWPVSLAIDRSGNTFIADRENSTIWRVSASGIITLAAGGGFDTGEGVVATAASINPAAVAVDAAGNVLIADLTRVRVVSTSGQIRTLAGAEYSSPQGSSPFGLIRGLAFDSVGNVLVAHGGGRLDRISATGAISAVAGNGTAAPYSGDGGPAILAQVSPAALARDSFGNTYFSDSRNHVIRKIAANGVVSTVAGTGAAGFAGDGGPAVKAQLNSPGGIAADVDGTVYFTDFGNDRIRKVAMDGYISTVWLNPDPGHETCPTGLAVDGAGNLYFGDFRGAVWKRNRSGSTSIVAGNGILEHSGDGGQATAGSVFGARTLAADAHGNLFIGELDGHVRKVAADGKISTVAGGGTNPLAHGLPATEAQLDPSGLAVDSGGAFYVSEQGAIFKVTPDGLIRIVALTSVSALAQDPPQGNVRALRTPDVLYPTSLSIDSLGALWIAETSGAILRVSLVSDPRLRH